MSSGTGWRLISDAESDPYYNMAVDESLLISVGAGGQPALRFYQWRGEAVSIGYFQSYDEIRAGLDADIDYTIVRRPTGGGAVIHDTDITFSIIWPERYLQGKVIDSYRAINTAIVDTLRHASLNVLDPDYYPGKRVGRPGFCFQEPTRYDILLNETKICGSAQRRRHGAALHQASFYPTLLPADMQHLSRTQYMDLICAAVEAVFGVELLRGYLTDDEAQCAQNLTEERYATIEWNRNR